jgi:5'-3' exonuclease
VSQTVELYDFARGERYGPAEVLAKFGVRPEQMADFLALAGDPVDDIPGVPGIGKKTAAALLAEFGDLDASYASLARLEELPLRGARALAAKLARGRDSAYLSRELARASYDAPVDAEPDDLVYRGAERELFQELVRRYGFETLAARVPRWR